MPSVLSEYLERFRRFLRALRPSVAAFAISIGDVDKGAILHDPRRRTAHRWDLSDLTGS
jgi:inhibitor of KinA sporulation pathway (predicted exonuclease)